MEKNKRLKTDTRRDPMFYLVTDLHKRILENGYIISNKKKDKLNIWKEQLSDLIRLRLVSKLWKTRFDQLFVNRFAVVLKNNVKAKPSIFPTLLFPNLIVKCCASYEAQLLRWLKNMVHLFPSIETLGLVVHCFDQDSKVFGLLEQMTNLREITLDNYQGENMKLKQLLNFRGLMNLTMMTTRERLTKEYSFLTGLRRLDLVLYDAVSFTSIPTNLVHLDWICIEGGAGANITEISKSLSSITRLEIKDVFQGTLCEQPMLKHLHVDPTPHGFGSIKLGPLFPKLEHLDLKITSRSSVHGFDLAKFPALKSLSLHIFDIEYIDLSSLNENVINNLDRLEIRVIGSNNKLFLDLIEKLNGYSLRPIRRQGTKWNQMLTFQ